MSTSVNPINSSPAVDPTQALGAAAGKATDQVVSEDTFLKLLVAQIKNQDPLNPTDSVQFVSQLAQFSELEQTIGIKSDLTAIRQDLEKTPAPANTNPTP